MGIYKELEELGFFKWYCTQYGGLVYQDYKPVYDDLPLDNIIRTELNACVFKFFREKYGYDILIKKCGKKTFQFNIELNYQENNDYHFDDYRFKSYEESEIECIERLIEIQKR
jgi:hypothetical protein